MWAILRQVILKVTLGRLPPLNAEFRAESDNITNTRIWSNPSGRVNPDGTLNKSFADPLGNFMCITGASTGREFRFGLRVSF